MKSFMMITQVCPESKLWIHSNLQQPILGFTYVFEVRLDFGLS